MNSLMKNQTRHRKLKMLRRGVSFDRLRPDSGNPREVAFAELWNYECLISQRDYALITRNGVLVSPNLERDEQVAATIIQWLGSNVGFCFLQEALRMCGYRIVECESERPVGLDAAPDWMPKQSYED